MRLAVDVGADTSGMDAGGPDAAGADDSVPEDCGPEDDGPGVDGSTEDRSELYVKIDALIPALGAEDFELDEKARTANFTEDGTEKI